MNVTYRGHVYYVESSTNVYALVQMIRQQQLDELWPLDPRD
jgi:hypothetical protein